MGKLADAITAESTWPGPRCTVCQFLAGPIPKDVRAELDAALVSATPSTVLAKALVRLGYDVKHGPLQRHRRGDCSRGRTS